MAPTAVAVFNTKVAGYVTFSDRKAGLYIEAHFTQIPAGAHGFHIHKAGDLRGEGCKLACDHYHKGPACDHGGPPGWKGPRHTGDLGNIDGVGVYRYILPGVTVADILGRSVIIHEDEDDFGLGNQPDSLITGHAGVRMACAIIGRIKC